MSKKRRQRSTAIRKRVEKKQREDDRARKKKEKLAAKGREDDLLIRMVVPTEAARGAVQQLIALEERLAEQSIRGWTDADLEGDYGLSWFARLLDESAELAPESARLTIDFPDAAKSPLLDKLQQLEMAASGLAVDWEGSGLVEVASALSHADEIQEEEEDEDADGETEASGDETSGDETSGDETDDDAAVDED